MADNLDRNLAVLLSDALYTFAVDPADPAFTLQRVQVKDYRTDTWLRVA